MTTTQLQAIAKLIRYWCLTATTEAGSGHASSSLSATDLMTSLMFGDQFHFDLKRPDNPNNDRLIFSKGHASPLLYALWAAAGAIKETELMTLRRFGSRLEGHPAMVFPYTEAATGSLGQGLSVGVGMALNAKYIDQLPYRTYVLLGDSEMAEGSVWEAFQLAAYYKLNNLVAIIDVNRFGQRGPTMYGHDVAAYRRRLTAFDWKVITVDGHNMEAIAAAYRAALDSGTKPTAIIAKTLKGKGVAVMENKDGWHAKIIKPDELAAVLKQFGPVDESIRGTVSEPKKLLPARPKTNRPGMQPLNFDQPMSTRRAYGEALVRLIPTLPNIIALDAEVSNSTFAELVKINCPHNFFEMFIAEQNMVGTAIGLSRRGKIPFVSTFAAFFTRAYDQIRMSQYSNSNIKFVGSHAGVSIGEDGASQMGLEDIALFRTINGSTVLYPADAISSVALVEASARQPGIVYLRTTRKDTPMLYKSAEKFPIGGSKTLRQSKADSVTIIAAGITVHEALKAAEQLTQSKINVRIIDLYSIKPLDLKTLQRAAKETKLLITVEDHYPEGGIGEAVCAALADTPCRVISLAVRKIPKSGKPDELLDYEEISAKEIVKAVKTVLK